MLLIAPIYAGITHSRSIPLVIPAAARSWQTGLFRHALVGAIRFCCWNHTDFVRSGGKLHTTACYFRKNWVISSLREALRARYSEKWELENPLVNLEFDSFQLSGECVTILHEPMRTPVQT